ncbi:MAG: hypothetical protein JWO33_379 [Caulobacteraceae bacterium]|nr:hypothetical protein [Caulobacteraceae bacterium]
MSQVAQPQPVVRRLTEGAAEVLERLSATSLESGKVNLISIDAVAAAFGTRWDSKRSQVYEHVERILERSLGEDGYFTRVSATDFLVVQPNAGQFGAQALCYRSFREIWTHFLGKEPQPERTVHKVTELSAHQITATEVDASEAMAGEAEEMEVAQSLEAAKAKAANKPLSPTKWAPFVASNGRRVDVVCHLEPVFSVRTRSRIALRFSRKVIDLATSEPLRSGEVAALNRSDLFRVDMATLSRGLAQLEADETAEPELSLIVPASYIALSHAPSRQAFIKALAEFAGKVEKGLILELHDLAGVPHANLSEVLATIRPLCLLAVGHLSAETPARSLKEVGLSAVSVSCPKLLGGEAAYIGWLKGWIRSAHVVARSVMVYRCASSRQMAMAAALGASHCSGPDDAEADFQGQPQPRQSSLSH